MKKTLNLTCDITKEQLLSYVRVPFDVPENVESLNIAYSYDSDHENSRKTEKGKNVIDFALLNHKGEDVGTRGSEIRETHISPTSSTPGFKAVEIVPGKWTAVLGIYQMKEDFLTVNIEVTFTFDSCRWIKGDTHLHTTNSDGVYTHQQVADMAAKKGLSYIVFTDHNNTMKGIAAPKAEELTVIKGVEFTNYRGHMNLWGAEEPYDGSFSIDDYETLLKYNKQAKERGALQCLNHPLCSLCPWLFGTENLHFDAVEVWNGPMRKDNLKAIAWWESLLKEGKKVTAVGGSDYHRDYVVTSFLGMPTTAVYVKRNDETDILDALKKGRVCIFHSPYSTELYMTCGKAVVGDSVKYEDGLNVEIQVRKMKKGHFLKVYDSEGLYFEAKGKGNKTFTVPVRKGNLYVRAEIQYKKGFFARLLHRAALFFMLRKEASEPIPPFVYAMTNPIYFE